MHARIFVLLLVVKSAFTFPIQNLQDKDELITRKGDPIPVSGKTFEERFQPIPVLHQSTENDKNSNTNPCRSWALCDKVKESNTDFKETQPDKMIGDNAQDE